MNVTYSVFFEGGYWITEGAVSIISLFLYTVVILMKAYDCVVEDLSKTYRYKVYADCSGDAIEKASKRHWGQDTLITAMHMQWAGRVLKDRYGKICPIL